MLFIYIVSGIKIFKLVQIILISAIKFLFAPLIALEMGFNYIQTIIYTTIGGILGVFFFFFLSNIIIRLYKKHLDIPIKKFFSRFRKTKKLVIVKTKRKFTRKNKFIIFLKSKLGMLGLAFLTPTILSIPLGTFLANKYFPNKKTILLYLSISVAIWSFVLSTICKLL